MAHRWKKKASFFELFKFHREASLLSRQTQNRIFPREMFSFSFCHTPVVRCAVQDPRYICFIEGEYINSKFKLSRMKMSNDDERKYICEIK